MYPLGLESFCVIRMRDNFSLRVGTESSLTSAYLVNVDDIYRFDNYTWVFVYYHLLRLQFMILHRDSPVDKHKKFAFLIAKLI